MRTVKATPGAKRLIESLRNMGYECSTAIADLIDNSIAAGASEVHVEIFGQQGSRPPAIVIADNGRGMDRDALHEAMRFGAFQEYAADDLGKYGLGLKTASLSQCRILTVSSKPKGSRDTRPRRSYARWDIEYVYGTDDWDLLTPSVEELEEWEADALNHEVARENGTVVLWTGLEDALPLLSAHEVRAREKFLATLIDEVSGQLIAMTPLIVYPSLAGVAVAFVLFRAFDIFKPYPIRKLERLPGGFGVMTDDVLAGIYAAVLTWLAHYLNWI